MSEQFVVVSKIKKHIKNKWGMNTSASVMEELSKIVSCEIDKAVKCAEKDKRKTVMDRDFDYTKECN